MPRVLIAVLSFVFATSLRAEVKVSEPVSFSGMCDASAGVALSADLFVVADDEGTTLRIFSRTNTAAPVFRLRLEHFLEVDPHDPEADVEGAARVGDVIYWIGSHAQNKAGKTRNSRHRFFATRIVSLDPPRIEPIGQPYFDLLGDLEVSPDLKDLHLTEAASRPPKEKHALNIEGLCARPDGSLLIGFRNPVPKKEALLVPLLNPAEITTNRNAHAVLGEPIQLDLNGRSIRDMVQRDGKYFIIGGSYNSADRFELFRWNGRKKITLLYKWEAHTFNPEAIISLPDENAFLVLSDDGNKRRFGIPCKDFPEAGRRFRGSVITLDAE